MHKLICTLVTTLTRYILLMERYVRGGDISRGINGLNIRSMISLGTLISLETVSGRRTERSVEVNEEIM